MSIEELRAKCNLLDVYWEKCLDPNNKEHPWYADMLPVKNGMFGRETERELLEDILKHLGAYNEHDVHAS